MLHDCAVLRLHLATKKAAHARAHTAEALVPGSTDETQPRPSLLIGPFLHCKRRTGNVTQDI